MKVDVYDTYATPVGGGVMHFDVLVPSEADAEIAFKFARQWLNKIGQGETELKQSRCKFCHSQNASPDVIADIEGVGYHIIVMEGCGQANTQS